MTHGAISKNTESVLDSEPDLILILISTITMKMHHSAASDFYFQAGTRLTTAILVSVYSLSLITDITSFPLPFPSWVDDDDTK
jgi:hypothetical protein